MLETENNLVYTDSYVPAKASNTVKKYFGGSLDGTYDTDVTWTQTRSYRKGLRRPKPKFLDVTPYELLKHSFSGIAGTWSLASLDRSVVFDYRGMSGAGYLGDPNIASCRYRNGTGFDFDDNLRERALLKALSSLNQKDVDLAEFFGEWDQTAQLLGDAAHLTVDCLRLLRKRDLRGFLNRLKPDTVHRLPGSQAVVDAYLTFHYGIKPALQDVAGAVQALTRRPSSDARVSVKGTAAYDGDIRRDLDLGGNLHVKGYTTFQDSVRCVITATRRNLTAEDDLRWALGLDDPLSSAWNLTPFSFVLDWGFPVGQWLEGINASKYYTDWQVATTQYLRENTTYSGTQNSDGRYNYVSNIRGSLETFKLRRNIGTSIPIVGIPFKNPLGVEHCAKGLSLLASTLARGGEPPRYLRY